MGWKIFIYHNWLTLLANVSHSQKHFSQTHASIEMVKITPHREDEEANDNRISNKNVKK